MPQLTPGFLSASTGWGNIIRHLLVMCAHRSIIRWATFSAEINIKHLENGQNMLTFLQDELAF
jgi:hypothetical protein